jgi:hypothetical protein
MVNLETPLWQLTVGEFRELIGVNPAPDVKDFTEPKKYVYGLSGLCELISCSHPTAQRLKDSGTIPFIQTGRKLIFEAQAVLDALAKKKGVSTRG